MTTCPASPLLEQLLNDELRTDDREALERHLAECSTCQERLDRLAAADSARWRREPSATPPEVRNSDSLLWRRVAALGAVLLDSSVPVGDTQRSPTDGPGAAAEAALPTVPGYELLDELGRGGMAVVYRARQVSLGRIVALKMILAGPQAAAKERSMLRAEAQAMAALQHPNIVQIHEVGEHDGRVYLALEYLDGGSLARRLAGAPQPPRAAAELTATLARAAHFAHEHGVVHRDLKPANILMASPGVATPGLTTHQPKIADFGLAKRLDAGASLFGSAAIVGTPSYVAPEQVREKAGAVGPAVDIYALGAVLYECLTGRPPFRGESAYDTLLQVVHTDPVAPRQLQPTVPRDLETVCLKCLHKEPRRRYGSALELAEDLERFLAGKPVRARPIGPLTKFAKWVRRRPGIAALVALVALLTMAAFVLMAWQLDNADARTAAEAAAKDEAAKRAEHEQQARLAVEKLTAGSMFYQASALCERGEVALGLDVFAKGRDMAAHAGDTELARAFRHNLSAWPSRLIRERARLQHKSLVWAVAYSPHGDLVATASGDRTVQLWDARSAQPHGEPLPHDGPVFCVAFSPDGRSIVSGTDTNDAHHTGTITRWDVATGKAVRRWHSRRPVMELAFGHEGNLFVGLALPLAQLFDLTADEPLADLHTADPVFAVAISPDGKTVVSAGRAGVPRRWDTTARPLAGVAMQRIGPVANSIDKLAFSNDGLMLAGATPLVPGGAMARRAPHGEVCLWNVASGTLQGPALFDHGIVTALAFSPDNRLLAVGNVVADWNVDENRHRAVQGEVRFYEVASSRRMGRPLIHRLGVMAMAFSPDGQMLLTGAEDGNARLFSVACGELIGAPLPHEGAVKSVVFAPDGRTAVTGSAGGDKYRGAAGRLWEWPTDSVPIATLPFGAVDPMLAVHGAGEVLVARRDKNNPTRLLRFALPAGEPIVPALDVPKGVNDVAFSPDGQTLVCCGQDQVVRLWDPRTGTELRQIPYDEMPHRARYSPDGKVLLIASQPDTAGTIWLRDAATLTVRVKHVHRGGIYAVAFTPLGEALWIAEDGDRLHLWAWTPAGGVQQRWEQPLSFQKMSFTTDASAILAADVNGDVRLIDVATGKLRTVPPLRQERYGHLAIADDNRTVLIGDCEGIARLWDIVTARPLGPPLHHHDEIRAVAFVPNGRHFVTVDASATYVWRVPR